MQPAVVQSLNVQNQQQAQISQLQISQEAFAAALARTASLRPEQVQEMAATSGKDRPGMLGEERGENSGRRESGRAVAEKDDIAAETQLDQSPAPSGSRIDLIV